MGKRVQKSVELNSTEDHVLGNGTLEHQSDWSRCNSFSSSSNDSAVFCTTYLQKPSFPVRKRLAREENSNQLSKRSRNSSGSSASSNMSCISEKDIKKMPGLISANPISSIAGTDVRKIENVTNLSSITPSTLALQHEALFNKRLSHSMAMDSVLPFRHNLRRNIRKKTCSCDCTATCTTVVVSRQYKGIGEKTVEEKTVISRTKVKRYVNGNDTQLSPMRNVKMTSSSISFKGDASPKHESSRKRRSEIQQLYDSLHEIKWAKNFSPDNILRQFDVRQAASCSVFGRSPEDRPCPSETHTPKKRKFSYNKFNKSASSDKSPTITKSNRPLFQNHSANSYGTRSKGRTASSGTAHIIKLNKDRSPPVLEKSVSDNGDLASNNSGLFSAYPLLSRESPIKLSTNRSNEKQSNVKNFESPDFNSAQNNCSSCNTVDLVPKKFRTFDFKSQSNVENAIESITDFSSTFFDIAEEGIRTIDACFREVGAEVVVSTCYETEFELPLLTSVEEAHLSEGTSSLNGGPPILEPSTESLNTEKLSGSSCNSSLKNDSCNLNSKPSEHMSSSIAEPVPQKFFPLIDFKSLPEEDYSPLACFVEGVDTVKCFGDVKTENVDDSKPKLNLPLLTSADEIGLPEQSLVIYEGPPVLERCMDISDRKFSQNVKPRIESDIKNAKMYSSNSNKINFEMHTKVNCVNNEAHALTQNSKDLKKLHNELLARSLIIQAGRRIFNKYLKFMHSQSNKQCSPSYICKKFSKVSGIDRDSNKLPSKSNIEETFMILNSPSKNSPTISVFHTSHQQIPITSPVSIENIQTASSSLKSRTSDHVSNTDNASASLEMCCRTVESVENMNNTTVIRTFNQKISYSKSPEKNTLNHNSNSTILYHTQKEPLKYSSVTTKDSQVSSIFKHSSSHPSAAVASTSTSINILSEPKKKECLAIENVKVPPRVFTCHYQTIKVTHGNNYIQIILKVSRGKSIFLTHESLFELKEAITKAASDKSCRLLILNGFGQTFCLGLDLEPIVGSRKKNAVGEIANAVKDLITALADFHKPLVAIVNGAAFGLGMTILNHADVILATDNATFCMPYSKLGYSPEGGATLTLPLAVGTTVAMDLILRGQVLTAQQARNIGLVNEVVEVKHLPQDLVSRVQYMAENSVSAMETTKAMIKMCHLTQLPMVLENEVKLLPQMWLSPICQEAINNALQSGLLTDC